MPNTNDKFLQGASSSHTAGTTIEAGLPNITGATSYLVSTENSVTTGAIHNDTYISNNGVSSVSSSSIKFRSLSLDASLSDSIYGNSNTVQPPAIVINYIIKY